MDIIQSIREEPQKWKQREHTIDHDDGLKIWTANGLSFYNTYPNGSVGFLWKIRFAKAYKWWTENQPVSTNKEMDNG